MHCNGMSRRIKLRPIWEKIHPGCQCFQLLWHDVTNNGYILQEQKRCVQSFSYHVFNPRALIFGSITGSTEHFGGTQFTTQITSDTCGQTRNHRHFLTLTEFPRHHNRQPLSGGMFKCCASLGCSNLWWYGCVLAWRPSGHPTDTIHPADTSLWKPLICPCFAIIDSVYSEGV